ncbi:MAG: aminotransferase class I/II-fold pyridoxal phosphate-dependent enzyme [Phycisphaerales bacterium]|nr:aminotransferase class I/II-fold pyridoxal phosphate-dependent enzyme [Phycisphaerales bacterium]
MTQTIDLRSDTITKPTEGMRRAMAQAEVGDDMFGEDPTVRRLEERFCEITGMEASVFVPSGTMANQLAIRAQTEPGDEVITHPESHIIHYESGGPAALSGVMIQPAPGLRGLFTAEQVRALVRSDDAHCAVSRLVTVENTHNRGGGKVWPIDQLHAVFDAAHDLGMRAHVDGARIWNASVASGERVRAILANADSVSACFSKGLGAPVGSALASDGATIKRARRFRKMFGGSMRQAGVLAAAALYALDHHLGRLAEDHANARAFAGRLAETPGVVLDPAGVETNIVYFGIDPAWGTAAAACERCAREGVRMFDTGPGTIRAVMHLHVSAADALEAAARIGRALGR